MDEFKQVYDDGELLRKELQIDDSSIYKLNEELKRQSVLSLEILLLSRYAKIKLNRVIVEEEVLTAKITQEICRQEAEEGRRVASSAKDKLKKTDIPLYKRYQEKKRELLDAQEEVEYLKSLQYIMSQRGELLMEILKIDRSKVKNESMLQSDAGMNARINLYNKKIKDLTERK